MNEPTGDPVVEAVDALSGKVDALQGEIRRLGASSAALPAVESERDAASYAWLASLEAPMRRPPQIPRLLLEGLFLAACAAAAAIADLDAVAIGGVMVGAWVLVALIEWAASSADRRREELLYRVPAQPSEPVQSADPAWFSPPVEHTLLDAGTDDEGFTAVTRLPPRDDTLHLPPLDETAELRRQD